MTTPVELEMRCPVCEAEGAKPLFARRGKSYARCHDCGLIYDRTPPSSEEARAFYEENYYESFGEQTKSIQSARLSIYEDLLVEGEAHRQTGRLLDIGCGHGDFLFKAQARGWEPWGIEPSREAARAAQKILGDRVLNQTLDDVRFPPNHFDVITLWNVLDCLSDPVTAVRKIREWLTPGGLLLIRTPNAFFHVAIFQFYSRFQRVLSGAGWRKEASVFLRSNFTPPTLKRLLGEAGFTSVQIENGVPTRGDAYGVFSRSVWMGAAKSLLYGMARFLAFLSGGQWMIGPNLMVLASKGKPVSDPRARVLQIRIFLKRIVLHLLAGLGYLLGLPLWFRLAGKHREIRVLRYHSVSESRASDVNVKESEFRKHLNFIDRHYPVISLEAVLGLLQTRKLPSRGAVVLTFDDGTEDNYKVVFPLLKKKKFPAAIFLLTGGEGGDRRLPHLADGQPEYNRLLAWDKVREMAQAGVELGSHGEHHHRLARLSDEAVKKDLLESKSRIEKEIQAPVSFFSYPYGTAVDFDSRIERLVRESGYRAAFSAIFGTNGPATDLFSIRRIGIEASDTPFTFRAKLNGALGLLAIFDLPPIRRLLRGFDSLFLKTSPLLLVSVDFPPHTDGVSTISRELSARIAGKGREVIVIGPSDRGDREFDRRQSYRVFRLPGYEWGYLRFLPIFLAMPFVVLGFGIRRVFAMNIAYGGVLSWLLSYVSGLEYLIFAYGYEFEKVKQASLARRIYQSIYRRAKGIVTCSALVKRRLVEFGVNPEKIKVLYPAVDLEKYRPEPVSDAFLKEKGLAGRKILLTVGRLIERKGHDRVLETLPKVIQRFPEVLYCIVGIGPHEKNLRDLIQRLNLENHVRLMGKVADSEITSLYNACDLFLMPSREISGVGQIEGFGIVYLEANACGKPVIGGRSGGVAEAIRDGETGFLVDPDSSDEIAEKILFLFSHPEEAHRMGAKGLEWVRENFNWDRYVEEAHRLLEGGSSS